VNLCADERAALDALRGWLLARFGARLRELTLFGSRARGEGDEDSDLDVAVVVDGLTSAEGREIAWFCGDLLTEHGVIVSMFAVSVERMQELRRRDRLIAQEIARDGVPVAVLSREGWVDADPRPDALRPPSQARAAPHAGSSSSSSPKSTPTWSGIASNGSARTCSPRSAARIST
jgi:hypothetical protein